MEKEFKLTIETKDEVVANNLFLAIAEVLSNPKHGGGYISYTNEAMQLLIERNTEDVDLEKVDDMDKLHIIM